MKRVLTVILSAGFMLACNPGSNKEKNTEPAAAENHDEHSEKTGGLQLNNGSKWKADTATFSNVALLKTILSGAKKESLENFSQTATELQGGLNKMVAECKMKGADHEALHHWLEPLLEKTKALKAANTTESAAAILSDIEKQVEIFNQYFELS